MAEIQRHADSCAQIDEYLLLWWRWDERMGIIDWLLGKWRSGTETGYDREGAHRGVRRDHVLINVIYADDSEDIVPDYIFEQLLQLNKIKRFYRYSESRWVTVGVDPIRKSKKGRGYKGLERRKPRRRI